jgi:hypothetical protein
MFMDKTRFNNALLFHGLLEIHKEAQESGTGAWKL